jgi:hypothetical protein
VRVPAGVAAELRSKPQQLGIVDLAYLDIHEHRVGGIQDDCQVRRCRPHHVRVDDPLQPAVRCFDVILGDAVLDAK